MVKLGKKKTHSLAFLPRKKAIDPHTMGTETSTPLTLLFQFYKKSKLCIVPRNKSRNENVVVFSNLKSFVGLGFIEQQSMYIYLIIIATINANAQLRLRGRQDVDMRILHDSEIERRFLFLSELYAQSLRTEQGDTWVKSVGLFYLPRHLCFVTMID